jgi:hypothetical protein
MEIRNWLACSILIFSLSACGGGSGGDAGSASSTSSSLEFSLASNSISFVADKRFVGPNPYGVIATVNPKTAGTLYVLISVTGDAVSHVSNFTITSPTSGSASVYAANPSLLSVGVHSSTITIRACVNSSTCASGELSGSPQTVTVNYTIQQPQVEIDTVLPRIAISNQSSDVIIRGAGFSGVTSVRFGSTQATSFSIVSSTEIRAKYPALSSGTYAVSLDAGNVQFSGSLSVVDAITYAATKLTYPAPTPVVGAAMQPRYDAERRAIYVALKGAQATDNRLVKYSASGASWTTSIVKTIPNLRDVILGPTDAFLLGYTSDSLLTIDPNTLDVTATYKVPAGFVLAENFINGLGLTNDGYAIVTFGYHGSGYGPIYFFSLRTRLFTLVWPDRYFASLVLFVDSAHNYPPATSADGATAFIDYYAYTPSTGTFLTKAFSHDLQDNNVLPPIQMDVKGTRLALSGVIDHYLYASPKYTDIYDAAYNLLGRINESPYGPLHDRMSVVSPDGSRIYILQYNVTTSSIEAVVTYDLLNQPSTGSFSTIGSPLIPPSMKVTSYNTSATISPDGKTLFVSADDGLFVQPLL